jgi:hypothetical protein
MTLAIDNSRWYARRNGIVRGPFTDEHIARYVLLGRIRLNDELSLDRISWRAATEYPRLFPGGSLQPSNRDEYQRLMAARTAADERTGQRRMTEPADARPARKERRVSADRRERGNGQYIPGHSGMSDLMHAPHRVNNRVHQPLRTVLLAMLLMTLVVAFFGITGR